MATRRALGSDTHRSYTPVEPAAFLSDDGVLVRRVRLLDPPVAEDAIHRSTLDHRLVWPCTGAATIAIGSAAALVIGRPGAVWVPGGVSLRLLGGERAWTAHFHAESCPRDWDRVAHLELAPLATAIFEHVASSPHPKRVAALISTAVDEVRAELASAAVPLPLPADPLARAVADALATDPSDRRGLAAWAHDVGCGERTLRRIFADETGLSFGRWRTRLRIHRAMAALDEGTAVEVVARLCGYRSPVAFTRAFRLETGYTPTGFVARRRRAGDRPVLHAIEPVLHGRRSDTLSPSTDDTAPLGGAETATDVEETDLNMTTRPMSLPFDSDDATRPTRRQFIGLMAAAGVVVACGSDDAGETAGDADDVEPVTVAHAGGETTFETIPQRVVIMDDAMLGDVLPFGVVPIGTAAATGEPTVIEVWQDEAGTADIENVSPDFTPNLEAVAGVRPDAIFAMAWQVGEPYWNDLQQIAPTIAVETDTNPETLDRRFDEVALRTYSQVFRSEGVVDELIADYELRIAAIRSEFGELIDELLLSYVFVGVDAVQADFSGGWLGSILDDVGFAFPPQQIANPMSEFRPFRTEFSFELTPEFLGDSDVILNGDPTRSDLGVDRGFPAAALVANPLLEELPAHEADRVFSVSGRVWFLRTVRGRFFVLDQLETEILPALRDSMA